MSGLKWYLPDYRGGHQLIEVTEAAVKYLNQVRGDDHVTLGVKGGGCSGFQYVWDFKKNWPDVTWSEPYGGALVLDPMAEMYVAGCTIDYVTELGGAYLKVINPNAVMAMLFCTVVITKSVHASINAIQILSQSFLQTPKVKLNGDL